MNADAFLGSGQTSVIEPLYLTKTTQHSHTEVTLTSHSHAGSQNCYQIF